MLAQSPLSISTSSSSFLIPNFKVTRKSTFCTINSRYYTPLSTTTTTTTTTTTNNNNNNTINSKPSIPIPIPSPISKNNDEHNKKDSNYKDNRSISQINVPRQKHISVSKSELLDSLTTFLTDHGGGGGEDSVVSHFILLASCLDSILHAEHKAILEEMRADYFASQPARNVEDLPNNGIEKEGPVDVMETVDVVDDRGNGSASTSKDDRSELEDDQMSLLDGFDLMKLFSSISTSSEKDVKENSSTSEVAAATRFQRSFMKLLQDAQFEELSAKDLMLTSALNTDYLLNLPIYVDWKKASESNAIIFRRGYSTEKEKGLLIVEKLDFLQSKVLRAVFGLVSRPLLKIGVWIKEVIQNVSQNEDISLFIERIQLWVQETSINQQLYTSEMQTPNDTSKADGDLDMDLPMWLAAQKAVSRYEGFLSSIGPRRRLIRKFLAWIGFLPSIPEVPVEIDSESSVVAESHMRPVNLSRISLNDIWRPATNQYCDNNVWRMLKAGFSIIFSQSVLQEPAFDELILLYTEEPEDTKDKEKSEIPSLQLKIYEKIPVPDLPVIFPHKKLSFRIIDTVRLDAASIIGLLAYGINYRFENVLSSPSAFMLDAIALTALIVFVVRVGLGYKQTSDRYELLVNRTLYEKTLASGFGSVHFLLDASPGETLFSTCFMSIRSPSDGHLNYKECILAYAVLLKAKKDQLPSRKFLGEECERFLYTTFKEKVEMPVDKAVDMLIKFGLVQEKKLSDKNLLITVPCSEAYDALRERWECLLR